MLEASTISALRDAGIAIAVSIVLATIFITATNFIKVILVANNNAADKRWNDMLDYQNKNLDVQLKQLDSLNTIGNSMNDGMAEIRERFDTLDENILLVRKDMEAIKIAIFNETQAGG